jgi:chromosome segregation ATPase
MTDFNNVTAGMAAGALVGHRMGSELRDMMQERAIAKDAHETIKQWEIYSENLKRQLNERNIQLANANNKIEILDEKIEKISDIVLDYASRVDDRDEQLNQKNAELEEMRAAEEKRRQLEEAHAQHRAYLEKQIARLTSSSTNNSAKAAAYEGLFRLLASEMARSEDIENFKVLNPEFIQKAYERAHAGFMRTGQIDYQPNLDPAEVAVRARPLKMG